MNHLEVWEIEKAWDRERPTKNFRKSNISEASYFQIRALDNAAHYRRCCLDMKLRPNEYPAHLPISHWAKLARDWLGKAKSSRRAALQSKEAV